MTAPMSQVEAWRKQGTELRSKLESEREELHKRLAEINIALNALPRGHENTNGGDSIGAIVQSIVRRDPGVQAAKIVEDVLAERPSVSGKVVHAILYRLRKDDKIVAKGRRGERRYYLQTAKTTEAKEPSVRASKPYKELAARFFAHSPGTHSVAEVAKAIECDNMAQTRNILVRLTNARVIRRVAEGVYERNVPSAGSEANDTGS